MMPGGNSGHGMPELHRANKWVSRREGFTLLELIVSIAIIGVIILIVTGAMRLGFRSVDSGERKIESLERMRSSLTIIENQLHSQLPLSYDDNGARKYAFRGERSLLEFSSNYSIWRGSKGYVLVSYKIDTGRDGKKALTASENIIGFGGGGETRLLDNLDDIHFEYFYKGPTDEKGAWTDEWTDETGLPEKMRLHLVNGTRELALIVPTRARGFQPAASPAANPLERFTDLFKKK